MGLSTGEVPEGDTESGAGVVERAESVLPVGVLLGLEHDYRIQAEPTGKDGMMCGLDRPTGQRHPGGAHRQYRAMTVDDETGGLRRLDGDPKKAGDDVRGPNRDDAERGIGLDQALCHVVDDAVPTHRNDNAGTALDGLSGLCLGVGRRLGPQGLHIRDSSQHRHHGPMGAAGELRCRRIGDDHDAVHLASSLQRYPPAP